MRLHIEGLVEQGTAELETRRMGDKAACGEFAAGLFADAIVAPVRLVVDEALLVVEQWIEQDHAMQQARVAGGEVRADAATETRPDDADRSPADLVPHMLDRREDVIEHTRDREILLPALAFTVRTVIKAKIRQSGAGQAVRQAAEEASFFARDATAVHENGRRAGDNGRPHECAAQPQP